MTVAEFARIQTLTGFANKAWWVPSAGRDLSDLGRNEQLQVPLGNRDLLFGKSLEKIVVGQFACHSRARGNPETAAIL